MPPPEALPPELWHLIIHALNDDCFAWIVLRHVSSYMRLVTEDVFARHMLRTCSVRFAGSSAQNLLPPDLQEPQDGLQRSHYLPPGEYNAADDSLYRPQTFRFQPSVFMPADSKLKLVLTLCDPASDPSFIMANPKPEAFPLDLLAEIFFDIGPDTPSNHARLMNDAHFVRYNNQLKCMRLPSLVIDTNTRIITLDWRQLCRDFLYDEWKCRVTSRSLGGSWARLTPK